MGDWMAKEIDLTHEAINDIMSHRMRKGSLFTDNHVGANGDEPIGSVRQATHRDQTHIYRKQHSGDWAREGSADDVWPESDIELTDDQKGDILVDMEKKPTISTLIPNAEKYIDEHFNVLLIALHGVGKTVSLVDICRAKGIKYKYYSCSTLDPYTDLVGVPTPRDYCPECQTYHKDSPKCPDCQSSTVESLKMVRPRDVDEAELIFFDEFNRADSKTQNALFEIMQFKTINGEPLPNLKAVWAAINPPEDEQNYAVEAIDPAAMDRFDLYIEMTPKVSIEYMAKHMPKPIAKVLKNWWDEHMNAIRAGKLNAHSDYLSPRRLEKIGLVWCATHNSKSVLAALPRGGQFEGRKLTDMLQLAQKEVNKANGIEDDFEEEDEVDLGGTGLGDRPYEGFVYRRPNLRIEEDKVVEFLEKHPMHYATHEKIVETLKSGIGGEELVKKFGKIINALNASNLEGMVASFPQAKQNEMRKGFVEVYETEKPRAKKLKSLYKVLSQGMSQNTYPGWPAKL